MEKLLKGNYDLVEKEDGEVTDQRKSSVDEFEERAMERLGGSIAFVMKGNKFVWDEEENVTGRTGESD